MRHSALARLGGLILPLALAACTVIPSQPAPHGLPTAPTAPPPPTNAAALGVRPGPPVDTLDLASARPGAALRSFIESCRALLVRTDTTGLTRPAQWKPACDAARTWPADRASAFFAQYFETARVGDGRT